MQFHDYNGVHKKFHGAIDGFLDIHLEVNGKEVSLVDDKEYSVSISSALLHLLSVFLGDCGNVGADWSRFEYLVALWEAQHKLINEDVMLPSRIICSSFQCPGKSPLFA